MTDLITRIILGAVELVLTAPLWILAWLWFVDWRVKDDERR